jgi:hypothetical protein
MACGGICGVKAPLGNDAVVGEEVCERPGYGDDGPLEYGIMCGPSPDECADQLGCALGDDPIRGEVRTPKGNPNPFGVAGVAVVVGDKRPSDVSLSPPDVARRRRIGPCEGCDCLCCTACMCWYCSMICD